MIEIPRFRAAVNINHSHRLVNAGAINKFANEDECVLCCMIVILSNNLIAVIDVFGSNIMGAGRDDL